MKKETSEHELRFWTRIENANIWRIEEIPKMHPSSPKYKNLWKQYSRWCVEGFWGPDFGHYRFMPPKLFFYINFWIMVRDEGDDLSNKLRPKLRDTDWEIFYGLIVAKGFSGFKDDPDYCCDHRLRDYLHGKIDKKKLPDFCLRSDGRLKEYEDPLHYVKRLHSAPYGAAMYTNPPKNFMVFGARSSGKTYTISAAAWHEIIFCGETDYDKYLSKKRNRNQEEAGLCIGAANTGKSAQFFKYMEEQNRQFQINKDLGVYGNAGDDDYEPVPFFRNMVGVTTPNNAKSPWREEVKIKGPNGIDIDIGSGSFAKHVNYKDDPEAAASGRYNYNIIEEIGLLESSPTSWASNEFTVHRGTRKTGTLIGLGTSGDIEKVEGAKQIFLHPKDYDLVEYNDFWENSGQEGKIGLFLPVYMVNMDFKDENGNTDIQAAREHHWEKLETLKDNAVRYRAACMHAPLVPSHMWISSAGSFLPKEEALLQEKKLMVRNLWKDLAKPVKLIWDTDAPRGVRAETDNSLQMIVSPYIDGADKLQDRKGCVVIYREPILDNKKKDLYFIVHDPYVSSYSGESLGVAYVVANPKYLPEGYPGNVIMATYIGKPESLETYNENLEKLVAYYGNPQHGLWYESNRGENVRFHFVKRNKQSVLSLRPTLIKGSKIHEQRISENGYIVGNKVAKLNMIQYLNDWLLEETSIDGETMKNIERIPCLYTLRQISLFEVDEDENFDGVSALLGLPLAIKEQEITILTDKTKENKLTFLSQNKTLHGKHGNRGPTFSNHFKGK
jgi:hypothetical protein